MTGLRILILLATAAALLTGCVKSEIDLPLQTAETISFRPATLATKAPSYTNDAGTNPIITMGIYASTTGSEDYNPSRHSVNYLRNVKVNRVDANSVWATSDPYNWPVGKTTFFGYAPYNTTPENDISTAHTGAPVIDFKVADNQLEQIDLLIASPVKNVTKTPNAITIPMKHALTKIGFAARLSHDMDEIPSINRVRIIKVEISGVYSSGKHELNAETTWHSLSARKTDDSPFVIYDDIGNLGGLRQTDLTTSYQKLTLNDGYLFMIPQSFTEGTAKIRVYVVADWITGQENSSFDDPIEFDLALTGLEWNQGEAINYNINIDLSDHLMTNSTLSAELVPWDQTEIESDIYLRQLNVTRVKADVYDAAVTRIYFWSNQPKEAVYVSPKCYVGTLPSAGGVEQNVNDIFLDLTAENPWEATNLHYDDNTGEGYFDLDRINSNSVAQNYLIYLYAGGLRRSIQINVINTNYPMPIGSATSPFVGTFHRHDEYGERIITWNNDGPWIAVIEPENSFKDINGNGGNPDYLDVIFDRKVSPSQEIGILHTTNPGNAEDYPVTNSWDKLVAINAKETRALTGNGKVYMRVGWKKGGSRAAAISNRYAKITIRDQIHDIASSKVLGVLFIRKGETPDYVMRKEDPIVGNYSSSNRNDAVKFSPYDVTSPYGNGLKNNYYDYPVIGSGGGKHLSYPTQGGSYFKWGSGRGISSMTSLFSKTPLSGYAKNSNTPAMWSNAIDVCPDGYRAPSYDNRVESVASSFSFPYASLDGLEMVQSIYVKPEQMNNTPYDWFKKLPYPENSEANWSFGYYADGFFDRGPVTINEPAHYEKNISVQYNGQEGYDGMLVFNPTSLSSLFLPSSGYISPSIGLEVPGNTFSVNLTTRITGFPTRTTNMYLLKQPDIGNPYVNRITISGDNNLHRGQSVRCVVGEKKDITSDGKCVVFYAYGYNDPSDYADNFLPAPDRGNLGNTFKIRYGATGKWNTKQDGTGTRYSEGDTFTFTEKFTILYAIL